MDHSACNLARPVAAGLAQAASRQADRAEQANRPQTHSTCALPPVQLAVLQVACVDEQRRVSPLWHTERWLNASRASGRSMTWTNGTRTGQMHQGAVNTSMCSSSSVSIGSEHSWHVSGGALALPAMLRQCLSASKGFNGSLCALPGAAAASLISCQQGMPNHVDESMGGHRSAECGRAFKIGVETIATPRTLIT